MGLQAQDPTKLTITMKDKKVHSFNLADIDYIEFTDDQGGEQGTTPDVLTGKTYSISLADISTKECGVYRVYSGVDQVAEVCYEYVKDGDKADGRMLVAYPIGANGKANLAKGYVVGNGGSLVWNTATNRCTYTAGTASEATTIYLEDGEWVASPSGTANGTSVFQYTIVDTRGNESTTYGVVKVGTQYWMAENLRATKLNDGTDIIMYKATQGSQWSNSSSPAYHLYGDGEIAEIQSTWGCMYNGYCIASDKIAPKGWAVTTIDDWQRLKDYLASGQSGKVKSEYEWNDNPGNGNNLSGLNVSPGGMFLYSSQTDDEYQWARATYWTATDTGNKTFAAVYISNSIALYNTEGQPSFPHGYSFGHYIRCIKK